MKRLCAALPLADAAIADKIRSCKADRSILVVATDRQPSPVHRRTGVEDEIGPVVIRVETIETTPTNEPMGALIKNISSQMTALATRVGTSQKLLQLYENSEQARPLVVVQALDLLVRDEGLVPKLAERVGDEVNGWFPAARVALELYLAADLAKKTAESESGLQILPSATGASTGNSSFSSAQEYAKLRDEYTHELRNGTYLRRRQPFRRFPEALVSSRLSRLEREGLERCLADTKEANVLGIWGPAGSGKSLLAELVCRRLAEHGALVVDVTNRDLNANSPVRSAWTRKTLARATAEVALELGVQKDTKFNRSRDAFMDAWEEAIVRREQTVFMLIDDLYSQRESRELITELRPKAADLGFHFVLVNRAQLRPIDQQEAFLGFSCRRWNRAEAIELLRTSLDGNLLPVLTAEFESGWLAEQQEFDSYLLEIIARNLGNIESRDKVELLMDAIHPQINPISSHMARTDAPAMELLTRVKEMLKSGRAPEAILSELEENPSVDTVQLLGQLAWYSQFEQESPLFGPADVTRWATGKLASAEDSQGLLDAGSVSGIFELDDRQEKYKWSNALVRDGCAALYLRQELRRLQPSTRAEMIKRLDEAGSVDILGLALDEDTLLVLVAALGLAATGPGDVLDRLVTSQMIMQMANDSERLDQFIGALVKAASRDEFRYETAAPISRALARVIPVSDRLRVFVEQCVPLGGSYSMLALGVLAAGYPNESFLTQVREKGGDRTTAIEMAVRLWPIDCLDILAVEWEDLIKAGKSDQVSRLFRTYCSKLGPSESTKLLQIAIRKIVERGSDGLWTVGVNVILGTWLERERQLPQDIVSECRNAASRSAISGAPLFAGELAKWICYSTNRDLTSPGTIWRVDSSGSFAMPSVSCEPATIASILQFSRSHPLVDLPSKSELQALARFENPELARDRLPRGFKLDDPVLPAMLSIWNGDSSTDEFILRENFDLQKDRIRWRPLLRLRPEAATVPIGSDSKS